MKTMRIGEVAELVLKPEYAYGEQGAGADIPPNATLIFKVEIVQIDDLKAKKFMKSDEELLQEGTTLKNQGNEYFKSKQFGEALELYKDALFTVNKIKNKTKEAQDLIKSCLLNGAVVSNNLGINKETVNYAS